MKTGLLSFTVCMMLIACGCGGGQEKEPSIYLYAFSVSADGTRVAIETLDVRPEAAPAGDGRWTTMIILLETGELMGERSGAHLVGWSPRDPNLLAVSEADEASNNPLLYRYISIYNTVTGKAARSHSYKLLPVNRDAVWSPDGKMLAILLLPTEEQSKQSLAEAERIAEETGADIGEVLRQVSVAANVIILKASESEGSENLEEAKWIALDYFPTGLAWSPDSNRLLWPASARRTDAAMLGYWDRRNERVETLRRRAICLHALYLVDEKRALVIFAPSGWSMFEQPLGAGVLNIETDAIEPVVRVGEDIDARKLEVPVGRDLARNGLWLYSGDVYLFDPNELCFYVQEVDGSPSGFPPLFAMYLRELSPVYLESSHSLLFIRDSQKLIRKDLTTGEETCIYDIVED